MNGGFVPLHCILEFFPLKSFILTEVKKIFFFFPLLVFSVLMQRIGDLLMFTRSVQMVRIPAMKVELLEGG